MSTVPENAVQAAASAIRVLGWGASTEDYARAALNAAMPFLERQLREQPKVTRQRATEEQQP